MLHTIQADFYRLFRSKGFWITEAILVLNILSGVIFGATGHVGVNTESKLPQATEVWTGFKALTNYSSSISVTILFTIITRRFQKRLYMSFVNWHATGKCL